MEKSIKYLLVVILVLLFGGNERLVGANPFIGDKVLPAEEYEFPFAVTVAYAPGNNILNHFCTGSLISRIHVLTAAHCINDTKPSEIVVTVGSIDVLRGIKYQVQEWKTFDQWATENNVIINSPNLINDIAIVTLKKEVKGIEPASISMLGMKDLYGKEVVALGWGLTNGHIKSRFLKKVKLRVLKRKQCLKNLNTNHYETSYVLNHLCANATPPISAGCGDSGGPLLINGNELVGITDSDCSSSDDPHYQTLHTSVKYYTKFIMDFVNSEKQDDIDNNLYPVYYPFL